MEPQNEPQSMRDILSAPLTRFETLTNQLFTALSSPAAATITPGPPVELFIKCDDDLVSALETVRQHQIKQRRIEQLKEDIVNLEWQLRDVCERLSDHKSELEQILRDGDEQLKIMERVEKASIPADYILAYAHNLTDYTSAPLTNTDPSPDQPAPPAFRPPYPDDAMLRRGFLGSRGNMLTEPTGETRDIAEPAISPIGPSRATIAPVDLPRERRHPGHYRPPVPDFGLDLSDD